jgi:hypothetical protein
MSYKKYIEDGIHYYIPHNKSICCGELIMDIAEIALSDNTLLKCPYSIETILDVVYKISIGDANSVKLYCGGKQYYIKDSATFNHFYGYSEVKNNFERYADYIIEDDKIVCGTGKLSDLIDRFTGIIR